MMRYETLLFDADQTLLDFHRSEREALIAALMQMGVRASEEMIRIYSEINLATWKRLERGEITKAALRTVRFAAGSFLPVVGGSVSESLRTVAGSVEYLRGVMGGAGLAVVFFAFLPTFLFVMLHRVTFLLAGAGAKLLGCDGEEKLLAELASVYGYFMAVIASLFVMLIFSLTLLAHCGAAVGG